MPRQEMRFSSHGSQLAAWFYPARAEGKRPCVVMAHGLGGTREMRLPAYAERFADAGFNVLLFDYRHFGASAGEPRQLLDIRSQLQDWHAAIAHARSLTQVDPEKIALWGTSLAGGHVLAVAAQDRRVAAVIAQVPHFSGPAGLLAIGPLQGLRLSLHGLYDRLRGLLGKAPHYIPASAMPGELGLLSSPGDHEGYQALQPHGVATDQRIAARFALQVGLYSPGRQLAGLSMPYLLQVALQDHCTPPGPVLSGCSKAPAVTLRQYACGHFDPYVEPMFSQIIADQLAFLQQQLG